MKLLVCGGRDYNDMDYVASCLQYVHDTRGIELIIHGDATGADNVGIPHTGDEYHVWPEHWRRLGRRAGPLRNQAMLDNEQPDGVVAFPGGDGTADMTTRARAGGVPVWEPAKTRAWRRVYA